MGILDKFLDNQAQKATEKHLEAIKGLYLGWEKLLSTATSEAEILARLNHVLKVADGLKQMYNSEDTIYNQAVNPKVNKCIAVYYCRQTNTIKSI